jgi:2-desacetyl-2-hydroxyethyl bacteriochlorophyllide A dehydrogenase
MQTRVKKAATTSADSDSAGSRLGPATVTQAVTDIAGSWCHRLLITAPGEVEVVPERLGRPGRGQVLARSVVSGISQGTELAWYRGLAPALHIGWDPDVRAYRDGTPGRGYPVAPGYELVAVVEETGAAVTRVQPGHLVYLDRPHADLHLVGEDDAAAGLLAEGTDPERAVFFPLARVALGSVHDAAISIGESVLVTGLGAVGLLAAQLALRAGARIVIGIDRYPRRLEAAGKLGIHTVLAGPGQDIARIVAKQADGEGADVAIEASGSYQLLHQAIRSVRACGRVVTVASYHGDQDGLLLGREYHRNRITLISSMTVNGCPQRIYPSWDLDRLNTVARGLVLDGTLVTAGLITHRIPFAAADTAYQLIGFHPDDTIKVVLTYGS